MPQNPNQPLSSSGMQPVGIPGSIFGGPITRDPREDPFGSMEPPKQTFDTHTNIKGGYKNIYGTALNLGYTPQTNTANLDFQFPIGDHQEGLNLGGSGFYRPGSNQDQGDYGFGINLSKKITPKVPLRAAYERVLQEGGVTPGPQTPTITQISSTDDEFGRQLRERLKQAHRDLTDEAMGIKPGAEKYGLNFGADFTQVPRFAGDPSLTGLTGLPGLPGQQSVPLNQQYR